MSGHDRSHQRLSPDDVHDPCQIIGEDREGHLGGCSPFAREFFPIAHRLELAAVDGNARRCEDGHLAAEFDKARTYRAKRHNIVFAEVRDRLGSGASRPSSHITSTLRPASRSSRRLDCTRFR